MTYIYLIDAGLVFTTENGDILPFHGQERKIRVIQAKSLDLAYHYQDRAIKLLVESLKGEKKSVVYRGNFVIVEEEEDENAG
jgi:hypothetical protein